MSVVLTVKDNIKYDKIFNHIKARLKDIIYASCIDLISYLRLTKLTGNPLHRRSGRLIRSFKPKKVIEEKNNLVGGIKTNAIYAFTHIGKSGDKTEIKAKNSKMLTIPLPGALTKGGVLKGGARSTAFRDTFLLKSKKGNLLIMGKTGKKKENIIPLFVLKKSVTVPARIDKNELILKMKNKIKDDFKGVISEYNKT